jgi:branched-chain amino acid transport system ATP-binding protein
MPISASETAPVLTVEGLAVRYGKVIAAADISLEVRQREIVTLLGPNGAGKTSVLKAIAGLVRAAKGRVIYFGGAGRHEIAGVPGHRLARLGVAHVPALNIVLPRMTVEENLDVGGRFLVADKAALRRAIDEMMQRFPILGERRRQYAGLLSGGEQRQLAIARALIPRPRLMLLDEPSIGLAPKTLAEIFSLLRQINENDGVAMLIVEQNVVKALELAHRAYVMRVGAMDFSGRSDELARSDRLAGAYLGS